MLIIGLDPGTHTGYAAVDFKGNLIETNSSKNLNISQVVDRILQLGTPCIVGCDKKNMPKTVDKLRATLGIQGVSPNKDLSINKKRKLTRNYAFKDKHQRDAIASAVHAYKKYRNIIDRIKIFAQKYRLDHMEEELLSKVIKEKMQIKQAAQQIIQNH